MEKPKIVEYFTPRGEVNYAVTDQYGVIVELVKEYNEAVIALSLVAT